MQERRWVPTRQASLFFVFLLVLVFVLTWTVFRPFVIFMVTGLFVAVLSLPIQRRVRRYMWRRSKRLAAFGTIIILFLILTIPLGLLGYALFNDARDVASSVEEGRVEEWTNDALDVVFGNQTPEARNNTLAWIADEVEPRAQEALSGLASRIIGGIGTFVIGMTVVLFVVYYVLADGEMLLQYIRRVTPIPVQQVDRILHEGRQAVHGIFVGQILTSLIQGALGGIGFLIAGLPGVVLWASVMAVLSLLPVVGAFLVWVPAAVFLLIKGEIWQGVFLLAWGAIVVSQVDNFLRPRLIGSRTNIHPLFVLVGILGGVAAFGFMGLFLGPLLVGITMSVLRVWESDYLDPASIEGADEPPRDETEDEPVTDQDNPPDENAVAALEAEAHGVPGPSKDMDSATASNPHSGPDASAHDTSDERE